MVGLLAALLAVRLVYPPAIEVVAPYFMIGIIAIVVWYSWRAWHSVRALRTPPVHRRLFGAGLVMGVLAITFFAGACAATFLLPEEWLGPVKGQKVAASRQAG